MLAAHLCSLTQDSMETWALNNNKNNQLKMRKNVAQTDTEKFKNKAQELRKWYASANKYTLKLFFFSSSFFTYF